MKTSVAMDSHAAFPDAASRPTQARLATALGPAFPPIEQLIERLSVAHPGTAGTWLFSPQIGWYQVQVLNSRRLLYLVPKRGGFTLSVILGDKALARLQAGPFQSRVAQRITQARRYPEGTLFEFKQGSLDVDLALALIEAKLHPEPSRREEPATTLVPSS